MNGHRIAPDDIRSGQWLAVMRWLDEDTESEYGYSLFFSRREAKSIGNPFYVHQALIPFLAIEVPNVKHPSNAGQRMTFDTRKAELLLLTPAYVAALIPGLFPAHTQAARTTAYDKTIRAVKKTGAELEAWEKRSFRGEVI